MPSPFSCFHSTFSFFPKAFQLKRRKFSKHFQTNENAFGKVFHISAILLKKFGEKEEAWLSSIIRYDNVTLTKSRGKKQKKVRDFVIFHKAGNKKDNGKQISSDIFWKLRLTKGCFWTVSWPLDITANFHPWKLAEILDPNWKTSAEAGIGKSCPCYYNNRP